MTTNKEKHSGAHNHDIFAIVSFLVSFCYAVSEKTWRNHFISISLALVALPVILRW